MASPVAENKSAFDSVKVPGANDTVYKEECCFSFDNPESENGLYICLNRFLGLGKRFVEDYYHLTGNRVFLNLKRTKKEKESSAEPEAKKPTRLAIGLEGGFDSGESEKLEYDEMSVVVLPGWVTYPLSDLPAQVSKSVEEVMKADSAAKKAELEKLAGTWDGEMRVVSKLAKDLVQLETTKKVPPSGWKCECCDVRENLWLNLTDGSIKCGRQFFDGTGGNNHALEHYQATGYPLAVKLGTITPSGADVFSYQEDDMVEDPYLATHLAHFGIDILKMQKTDKSMLELEVELNQRSWEWSALQESDNKLQPLYGPSLTGLCNLGNSCYVNSVMQVLFNCLPSFSQEYYRPSWNLKNYDDLVAPDSNFHLQLRKLAYGLLSGEYSPPPQDNSPKAIKPTMFRNLIGRGHVEFQTNKQQDVAEYILHLFSVIEKNSKAGHNPTDCVKFKYEDRIECCSSGKVKYMEDRYDYILQVPVDLNAALNKEDLQAYEARKQEVEKAGQKTDPKDQVRPHIPLKSCLQSFVAPCNIDDFFSSAINAKTQAKKTTKLRTFPDFLFIQVQKFTMGSDWLEKKLDVSLEVPDELELSWMKGQGKQAAEELLPETPDDFQVAPKQTIDTQVVSQLMEMGFPLGGSRKAAYFTAGQGFEAAVNWAMEHVGDADFDSPFEEPTTTATTATTGSKSFTPDTSSLDTLLSMGFSRDLCVKALKITRNNLEAALEKVMGGVVEEQEEEEVAPATPATSTDNFTDGPPKYRLKAFISHMGSSCKSGHYVCHVWKEGRWVIFNDEKVALSEKPPRELAYVYLYQRL